MCSTPEMSKQSDGSSGSWGSSGNFNHEARIFYILRKNHYLYYNTKEIL